MKTGYKIAIMFGALVAFMACGAAQAQTPGQGDIFTLQFDENGNGQINVNQGGNVADPGFAQLDPNTGVNALTYTLSGNVGTGVVDIMDTDGSLSDALDFYNIGDTGYMAFYSLPGPDLADTISGGYVPVGYVGATENADGSFAYYSGGSPGLNNDYYGISEENETVPDGGSTLAFLGGAFALVGAFSRKFRK